MLLKSFIQSQSNIFVPLRQNWDNLSLFYFSADLLEDLVVVLKVPDRIL